MGDLAETANDGAKRAQILDGARATFLARGFDAASMGEIARAAGVSKGTLYVYFDNKEALFRALIEERRRRTAERLANFDPDDHDAEAVLLGFARRLITELTTPEHVALVRMVVGAAERFPDLGRAFFEAGAGYGATRLADWLSAQVEAGVLAVEDPEGAAWRFLGMLHMPAMTATVLAARPRPSPEEVERWAAGAVRDFTRAHAPRTGAAADNVAMAPAAP